MAKKQSAQQVVESPVEQVDELDELLDGSGETDPVAAAKAAAKKAQAEAKAKIKEIQEAAKKAAKELKEKAKAEAKAAKEAIKPSRESKGVMVEFTTQAGELVRGKGVLYYVVRQDKKLHYKEASKVTLLPTETEVEAG